MEMKMDIESVKISLLLPLIITLLASMSEARKMDMDKIVFVITTQEFKHHRNIAIDTKYDLIEDLILLGCRQPKVGLSTY